ncbi:MAG: flagellar motor protein MotB [Gemmataceae bacterium]
MAGKGGGGAWKVAYADFVTAMMAFFLVMWISGQDQQIKRAVSYYFKDPVGASESSGSSKPTKTGALIETTPTGSVPKSESVSLGKGRKSYTSRGERSPSTKLIRDWLSNDKGAHDLAGAGLGLARPGPRQKPRRDATASASPSRPPSNSPASGR